MKKCIIICIVIIAGIKSYTQNNNVKLSILPTIWGEIRVGYERVIKEKQTAQINLGIIIPNELPNFIYDESKVEDYGGTIDLKNRVTGFSISGEYRFYTSSLREAPRGFYFAPYIKYNKYKIETSTEFGYEATPSEFADLTPTQQSKATYNGSGYDIDVIGNFDAGFRQLGLGAMIGYQWLIAQKVSIDWNFFGLGIDSYLFEVDITAEDMDVDYEKWGNEIREEMKDFTIVGDKVNVTTENDKVSVKAPFLFPNFKFAISVGIAF
ncbi:MAG: DUF3575 domain-containing protein [Vicingus serpentipes]|nr:DUF3575 domain-containing protein [Vicingus serpentipes]